MVAVLTTSVLTVQAPAEAASIDVVARNAAGAEELARAVLRDPSTLASAAFEAVPPSGSPHGVSDDLSFFPTEGDDFALLTTGSATLADDENTSGSSGVSLGGGSVRGNSDRDVTVLRLDLDVPAAVNCLRLDFAFYSEEFPEYVGSSYNDAFIAELDASTWTTSGSSISAPDNFAFDNAGNPITINTSGAEAMSALNASGTTYDGATALLEAATPVSPGRHALYLSIFDQGDGIYDSAAFVDDVRFESSSDCTPGAVTKDRVPLIFVPGITGSQLDSPDGDELWPRADTARSQTEDEFLRELALEPDGINEAVQPGPVVPSEVLRSVTIDLPGPWNNVQDVYRSTFEKLEESGYTEGEDLFAFAFDWRRSALHNATRLQQLVDEVRTTTGAERVDIMAHSQGGQVTQTMLSRAGSVGTVRRVLTLGTPVLGATKALGVLEFQAPCIAEAFGFCFLHPPTVQEVLTNFPGFYDLLPTQAYQVAVGSPLDVDRDTDGDGDVEGLQTYEEWTDLVRANRNDGLVTRSEIVHRDLDDFVAADPDVTILRIVGDDLGTLVRIREYETEDCFLWFFDCETVVDHELVQGNGDGTVATASASLVGAGGFDRRNGIPNAYAHGIGHGDLPKHDAVIDFALSFYGASVSASAAPAPMAKSSEPDPRRPQPQTLQAQATTATTGTIDDTPQPLTGLLIEVVGDNDGTVTATAGGFLGVPENLPAGSSVSELAGGTYVSTGRTDTFFLSHAGEYDALLRQTGDGALRIRITRVLDGEADETAAFVLPGVRAGAELMTSIDSAAPLGSLILAIDEDGDGTVDSELTPSVATSDDTPPRTVAQEEGVDETTGRVTLVAQDDISGVAETFYALEGDTSPRPYTGPFEAPLYSVVRFRSVDSAGNIEPVRTVTVDDVGDSAPGATPLLEGDHLQRLVAGEGDEDWFVFEVDDAGRYQLLLNGLTQDYDLRLHDAEGNLIAAPERRSTASERIQQHLEPGRYVVQVVGHDGAWSPDHRYHLQLRRL